MRRAITRWRGRGEEEERGSGEKEGGRWEDNHTWERERCRGREEK